MPMMRSSNPFEVPMLGNFTFVGGEDDLGVGAYDGAREAVDCHSCARRFYSGLPSVILPPSV